jgi:hypothetical protein
MYELKYGRLLTEGESFMGDIVCLEAVRFFSGYHAEIHEGHRLIYVYRNLIALLYVCNSYVCMN